MGVFLKTFFLVWVRAILFRGFLAEFELFTPFSNLIKFEWEGKSEIKKEWTFSTYPFFINSQKENLIANCAQSEQEAKITTEMYKERLAKLETEYEKSKKELEEAQRKITVFESAGILYKSRLTKTFCWHVSFISFSIVKYEWIRVHYRLSISINL